MSRYGWVIEVKQDKIAEYKRLHSAVWPDVLNMIKACNVLNYSIFLRELTPGKFYLFSYLEYTGSDFAADMAKMAADSVTQEWWKHCNPCQQKIELAKENEWWANMEEVFHCD